MWTLRKSALPLLSLLLLWPLLLLLLPLRLLPPLLRPLWLALANP